MEKESGGDPRAMLAAVRLLDEMELYRANGEGAGLRLLRTAEGLQLFEGRDPASGRTGGRARG